MVNNNIIYYFNSIATKLSKVMIDIKIGDKSNKKAGFAVLPMNQSSVLQFQLFPAASLH
jgi:hypothetical protein